MTVSIPTCDMLLLFWSNDTFSSMRFPWTLLNIARHLAGVSTLNFVCLSVCGHLSDITCDEIITKFEEADDSVGAGEGSWPGWGNSV